MSATYNLAVLGEPEAVAVEALKAEVAAMAATFDLHFGDEISWLIKPTDFNPSATTASAAVFFGKAGAVLPPQVEARRKDIPILPVVLDDSAGIESLLPASLRPINAMVFSKDGPRRIASALLEAVGLLPRQRQAFISYRRDESRPAALQLFDELSARRFEVFLDTHGVAAGADFQETLWHRLCDADVLVMLDTNTYFDSQWTSQEFGRALSKCISILRVGWPGVTPSPRVSTATSLSLAATDISPAGTFSDSALDKVCDSVEYLRSQSIAVRRLNLISSLSASLVHQGGKVEGLGAGGVVHLTLPNGKPGVALPVLGVPTSVALQRATTLALGHAAAVLFDHIGVQPSWMEHLEWLGGVIRTPRWLWSSQAGWHIAEWSATS